MEKLSQSMQERLDKWRKNTLQVPSAEKVSGKQQNNFVSRKDWGDDIRDHEAKDQAAWEQERFTNPMYEQYR